MCAIANLKSDRAGELVGGTSDFYKLARKKHINLTYADSEIKNQIWPVDLEIRELKMKKRGKNKMRAKNVPARAWNFCLVHQAKTLQLYCQGQACGDAQAMRQSLEKRLTLLIRCLVTREEVHGRDVRKIMSYS